MGSIDPQPPHGRSSDLRRDLWDTRHYRSIWTGEKLPRWHPLFPRVAMVRTSWGCRMTCSFCIVPHLCGGLHRTRPVQCSFTVCTPSPGTPDYQAMQPRIWVDNPHDLHDCMDPLTPTALPLSEFVRSFAEQAHVALEKVPMRVNRHLAAPDQMVRVALAGRTYHEGLKSIDRDYPEALRGDTLGAISPEGSA